MGKVAGSVEDPARKEENQEYFSAKITDVT